MTNHVHAFMRCAKTHPALHVHEICSMLGISVRTLRTQFKQLRGITPLRWLQGLRLECVHDELMRGPDASVTEVAMLYGFHELGRFSVAYRNRYGEAPSDTLTTGRRLKLCQSGKPGGTTRSRRMLDGWQAPTAMVL